ncbi:helix-turn-helix domain-containing protein [Microbispora rosea]|uniref:helix-turn-helix domain-containing protein n=1 Tax=Microbispora rosea TaxID=58117 RepID=UPI0037CA6306
MGQPRKELTPERSPLHLWGAELRAWRDRRGLSLARMGQLIRYNPSYLARIERGERKPPRELAEAADRKLNASGALTRLWDLIDDKPNAVRRPDDVANLHGHVANARQVIAEMPDFHGESEEAGMLVPCRAQDGRIIFVTLPRRTFLSGMGLGAVAAVTAGPSVAAQPRTLALPDMNPAEHFRQLRTALIDNDNLLGPLRVIPTVESQINAMQQLRQGLRGADARDLLHVQTQYAEFCGWLYHDAGDFRSAQYWTDRALEWSYATGHPETTTYILARKSQLAGDMRDAMQAVDLAEAALAQARPNSRLGAIAATYAAYGHALSGDATASQRTFEEAHEMLTQLDEDPTSPWGAWMDPSYVEVHRARGLAALGDHKAAAAGFRTAITALPPGYHRDRGVYLARESTAYAGASEPEQAAKVGAEALSIAAATGSARIMTELTRLDTQLERWQKVPAVAEFRQTFDSFIAHQA